MTQVETFNAQIRCIRPKPFDINMQFFLDVIDRRFDVTANVDGDQFKIQSNVLNCTGSYAFDCTATLCIRMECTRETCHELLRAIERSLRRADMIKAKRDVYLQYELQSVGVWVKLASEKLQANEGITSEDLEGKTAWF